MKSFYKKTTAISILLLCNIFFAGYFNASADETLLKTSDLKKEARKKAKKGWSLQNLIPQKKAKEAVQAKPIQKDPGMKPGPVKQPTSLTVAVKMLSESREKTRRLNDQVAILKKELKDSLDKLANARIKLENDRTIIRKLEKRLKQLEKTTRTYVVRQDDCLWKISARHDVYDDPSKWLWLYHANRDQIYDPNLIYPNMVLLVPQFEEDKD